MIHTRSLSSDHAIFIVRYNAHHFAPVLVLSSAFSSKLVHHLILFVYFMLSGRISIIIGENIFRSYTGITSENTDFHVLVA